jgi:hypothetical protein
MAPSARERIALVSLSIAVRALSGLLEGEHEPDVNPRRVDVAAGDGDAAQTTKAPVGAADSAARRRLRSHPFSHPPGGSA